MGISDSNIARAYEATNPADPEAKRQFAAVAMAKAMEAADIYWNGRSDLERLFAIQNGHGVIIRDDSADAPPPAGEVPAATTSDSSEEHVTDAELVPAEKPVVMQDDNPTAESLRKQLIAAGITPEA